ncbi:MAG TPA: OmpA family protein [Candidatus Sulfotelmatobacter sp.]|nr:OmpA family protein [Candidatus Sulfotelmatobacter sp.]
MLPSFSISKGPALSTVFATLMLLSISLSVFSSPASAQSDSNPKWDLFVGYQWLHPGGTVPSPFGDPNNPTPFKIPDMAKGFGSAFTYNFDPHWGVEFDLGHNWGDSNYETTGSVGPRFMWRTDTANYFLHTLVSLNRASINGLNPNNGVGAILGGGMDLPIRKNLAWRLFEADYVYARHNYADAAAPEFPDLRRPSFEGVRLRTGIVISWGGAPPIAPAASCSVQPSEVMVGEPITATVTASNFNPKHTVAYSWSSTGGQVTGAGTTARIDTTNATPGSYVVTAHVTDARTKNNNEASCTANFTVKPLPPKNPPTMSISASPTSLPAGGTANLTANCTSPDSVPVTVSGWTATSGTVSGAGSSATLNTAGAAPGSITVNASCTDARGLTGQGSAQVMVENPPPAKNPEIELLESRLALHSIYFPTAMPPVKNPKTGLLASQRQTLIALAADFKKYLADRPDAHLILEGHADVRGSDEYNQALSERRVNTTKLFLVEQGVPEANIETKAYGKQRNLSDEEVKQAVENNTEITSEERQRSIKHLRTIRLASNRRVDVTLSTTGQSSARQFPFNATDSLTLIGGREGAQKKGKAVPRRKAAPRKTGPKKSTP